VAAKKSLLGILKRTIIVRKDLRCSVNRMSICLSDVVGFRPLFGGYSVGPGLAALRVAG